MNITIELGKRLASNFQSDMVGFAKALPGGTVAKYALCSCYDILLSQKKIKRMEDLTIEEKKIIVGTARDIEDGRINNNEQMIRLCKCLYVLNFL